MRYPASRHDPLIDRIHAEPINLAFGSVARKVLQALAYHVGPEPVAESVETGSGKSTLLLSHLSRHHQVFSLNIQEVRQHPLMGPGVDFVDGPTQKTLPYYKFQAPIQLAFLDGPHAYPFPEMEYYFIYPHLAPGALLVLDDTQIPTLAHMFHFLKEDAMFDFLERVDNSAFFRRTGAPVFDPFSDNWEYQNYNLRRYPIGFVPRLKTVYARLPENWKQRLRTVLSRLNLR